MRLCCRCSAAMKIKDHLPLTKISWRPRTREGPWLVDKATLTAGAIASLSAASPSVCDVLVLLANPRISTPRSGSRRRRTDTAGFGTLEIRHLTLWHPALCSGDLWFCSSPGACVRPIMPLFTALHQTVWACVEDTCKCRQTDRSTTGLPKLENCCVHSLAAPLAAESAELATAAEERNNFLLKMF